MWEKRENGEGGRFGLLTLKGFSGDEETAGVDFGCVL